MPRLPTSLLLKAYRENPLLPLLLKECRTLETARNELRWLRERAFRHAREHSQGTRRLRAMCHGRARGVPLQYILGDQPFGDLEILCRRGVLIPRSDTESYTYEAARLVRQMALEMEDASSPSSTSSKNRNRPLRILDLCTGTGCIALLLHALLAPRFEIQIAGLDLSRVALGLARRNLEHNIGLGGLGSRARDDVRFYRADVLGTSASTGTIGDSSVPSVEDILSQYTTQLDPGLEAGPGPTEGGKATLPKIDLLISNPPYISTTDFRNGTTARSVRLFEPRLALVPPPAYPNTNTNTSTSTSTSASAGGGGGVLADKPEDIFYRRILGISLAVRAGITVLECGDRMQAERVVRMFWEMRRVGERTGVGEGEGMGQGAGFTVQVWPDTEEDRLANGFHYRDGSRCVIIRRGCV